MTAPAAQSTPPAQSADYSLRILWSLARWIEDTKGREALDAIAIGAGVRAGDFDGSTRWVSHEQFEKILSQARELSGSDEAFKEACAYKFKESYGAFRYMVWALSPRSLYEAAVKVSKTLTRAGAFEIIEAASSHLTVRYRSTAPESRLMCLSRQVHWVRGPQMWDLPPAQLEEHGCIANGDPFCEYRLRWFESWRILPVFVGFMVGLAVAVTARYFDSATLAWVSLPLLGAAIGHVLELRRMHGANLARGEELNAVLQDLGQAEAEARSEIFALNQRQREWIGLMERQIAERTTTLERIIEGLDSLQQTRASSLRGFSHDLRNPLLIVTSNAEFLRATVRDPDAQLIIGDLEKATYQIDKMLANLMEVATQNSASLRLQPEPIAVAPLADVFRRRLRALVHGRDIKSSVFCTREAPETVTIDPLVFDRIVDNLLTNASKYTHRGSILLELSGTPAQSGDPTRSFFTLKLSDTGEGIPRDQVEKIFRPRASGPLSRPSESGERPASPRSYGVGLSSVVRLLAQIGGRLDVMSKPGVGTTFWAHIPVTPPERKSQAPVADENLESMITKIVTIRRAEGS